MRRAAGTIPGYTAPETKQVEAFVAAHRADSRTWQQRMIDNAKPEERAALRQSLGLEEC